ncbi:hypothetical protein ACP49_09210 [Clostridium botulinum]|uniref:hypothetical protein n=1 Tax=Clostridium botulinum TaxID=1491 RepID=UPI0006A6B878|nr:hypothetical protein [Clostridium botulinum]KOM97240.1 hypothetical protein ACP53_04100 [Clostridium botulinum]KON00743.1 hypothetical protein ACP49_09210 [Clostridium botulinum]MBY7003517.1 hypothetical protein [Clostridium botulinum]MCR1146009.1 hypothetical protein [Clostridium botulinum]NFH93125.1 hypothetical protein [Clostridium botulinum]
MLSSTLYADKETQLTMDQQDDRFCLKLSQIFNYDLSIVGQREVFEKLVELIEKNLYDETTANEIYEKLVEKELLLEQAESQIQSLEDGIEFLQR